MKRFLLALAVSALTLSAAAQTNLQQAVASMSSKSALKGAVIGISVKDADGRELASLNPRTRLAPASNLKLVTTGAALHAFGPDYRFKTALAYSGEVKEGTLEGDLYIIGGGDPTLAAKDTNALNANALFWKWKSLLKSAGIQRINGRIIGDGSAFEGHLEHASWNYDDVGTYYGAGTNALSFYENAIDYKVSASAEGKTVNLTQAYPDTPWMHFQNYGITGPAGTGNSLYMYTTDLAPYAELRGSFATDRRPKTEHFANKYGDLTCAYYFWRNLKETGWEVTGGYARINRSGLIEGADFVPAQKSASERIGIGFTESPTLRQMAARTNFDSNNFYAEAFFRAMGESASGNACYDSCLVAINEVLSDLNLPADGILQADGSGLSRKNVLSADWMTSYLTAMLKSPDFPAFLASLPAPGQGTLSVLKIEGGERLRIKSGSMEGVLCYSGYVLDENGRPVRSFSILTNSLSSSSAQARSAVATLLTQLLNM